MRVILGSAADRCVLGMLLLEIAAGTHLFRSLSPNVIAYSLAADSVNIPDKLYEVQKEILCWKLMRNPAESWSCEQVSRWEKCERGLPNFFEEAIEREYPGKRPLTFMHQNAGQSDSRIYTHGKIAQRY